LSWHSTILFDTKYYIGEFWRPWDALLAKRMGLGGV